MNTYEDTYFYKIITLFIIVLIGFILNIISELMDDNYFFWFLIVLLVCLIYSGFRENIIEKIKNIYRLNKKNIKNIFAYSLVFTLSGLILSDSINLLNLAFNEVFTSTIRLNLILSFLVVSILVWITFNYIITNKMLGENFNNVIYQVLIILAYTFLFFKIFNHPENYSFFVAIFYILFLNVFGN
ncbi:Uncharacterised protein [Candidatus Tiddalikarchaeum anstoanum]|nr:Uncharacterised protein [Candidatus Tiddalikarchaeum anstoanum]